MSLNHRLCLPLSRPFEPIITPKGSHCFDLPAEFLVPKYKEMYMELAESWSANEQINKIPIKSIDYKKLDERLKSLNCVPQNVQFSVFIEKHQRCAQKLIQIFMDCGDFDDLLATAVYCRDRVNKQMFVYAYCVALFHREDTQDVDIPSVDKLMPQKFMPKHVFNQARSDYPSTNRTKRQADSNSQSQDKVIEIPFLATMNASNPEDKLTFFREDIGVCSHHWHWHLVYPTSGAQAKKDRRGELFYYMHHQVVARYDCVRMAHKVPKVVPLNNLHECIEEGYFPKMTTLTSARDIPSRQNRAYLYDLTRDPDDVSFKIRDLETFYDRIIEAIDRGYIIDSKGNNVSLSGKDGIDILGNITEASSLSMNRRLYGNYHNSGHTLISYCHDPNMEFNEDPGVMSDTSTAMRDPIFFRWHKNIDDIFVKYKNLLSPYEVDDLKFDGVSINNFSVLDHNDKETNELITFWQQSQVNLEHGVDFAAPGNRLVNVTHCNYQAFTYSIQAQNSNKDAVQGTCRIFLAPMNNEQDEPFFFEGARKLAMEMDRFTVKLQPGNNVIKRSSKNSALTIPFDRTYPTIDVDGEGKELPSTQPDAVKNFCGCGWPQNMLLPKGNVDGTQYYLFVMISDYSVDKIDQEASNGVCTDCIVFCGLRDRKYPDSRPMGYPFDVPGNDDVDEWSDFVALSPNMQSINISIRHLDDNAVSVFYDAKNKTVNGKSQ